MNPDYAQRRRVVVAIAITAIAGPAAFLLNRQPADEAGVVTTIAGTTPNGQLAGVDPDSNDGSFATTPLGTAPPGFATESTVVTQQDPAQIAVPRLPESVRGDASYSSAIEKTTECHAKGVPFMATLTVTNLDNSRSVDCVAAIGGPEPAHQVVMATAAFAQIADLTDAPIPVQITWVGP